ncbi:uncharacterized protein LOC110991094 [Acanthaster planci]|uniref:Uncharacterized protein LOC110991094 n=1 Tax=Acanthaster planci TaxID=133434 RepID=A0A8B8A2K8_ACAPL|nr:uncharacterized protein LOC110991094 [Acanthaster planci]
MMSDSLAAINVDQLSNAVSAVVNGTPGQSHNAGSTSQVQSAMNLQMPASNPVSVPNAVMVQVDRQLLSQLALPPAVSAVEVSTVDSALLQNSGGFQSGNSQQENRMVQSASGPPTTPQSTALTTQMMGQAASTSRQPASSIQNVALMNAVQMLGAPTANVNGAPALTQNTPSNQVVGTQMMIPSILTSMVPAVTTQSISQSSLLGSPLVLARDGGAGTGLANTFMAKQGGEQMLFNIQPEMPRGSNSTNSNNNILQLVPINNGSGGLSNHQQANSNPMINMSIAIHLPSQGNQDNKDPGNGQKQARTIPLSQLMTGQPIPVSQITGPIQMALEQGQDRGSISSGNVLPAPQFNSSVQGVVSASQVTGQVTRSAVQSPMSVPLSQLAVAQAVPVSQIATRLSDCSSQGGSSLPSNSASQHIQIPHSVLQSFPPNSVNAPSFVANTTMQALTTASQITMPTPTPAQAPVVMMGQEMQGKPYWNLQSLEHGSQLTSDLTSSLTTSLTAQALDGPSIAPISKSKAPKQVEMGLGMLSISPDGLVSSMNADDMATLDLGATESIENLTLPLEEEASNIWCIECNHYNPTTCTTHGPPTFIPDAEIPCRAKLTLPNMLKLSESLTNRKNIRCGVIAVENIQQRCQFGPLVGKVINKSDDILEADSNRIWKIFRNGIVSHFIDVSDENQSNWMRYVRLASRTQEQNVVVHQSGGNIYFTTNKQITMGEELRAWYSQDYARWFGVPDKPGSSFHCTQCPMQFLQRRQLSQHLGFKHPDMASRRYKCSLCPRAFVSSTKLQLHMLTHMGLKPYKCSHCGKQFSDPSNLRIHSRIHTEEKRFICDICQKAFRQKIHLISHMTTHTGEKRLKCPYCELTFSTHSTLTQHRHSHDTGKELRCEKCDRKFKTYRILQKHIKTHSSQRNFKCASCSKAFYTRYHAKRHHQKCRGLPEERGKKRDERREEGKDGEKKARRRRGRPARHPRHTSEESTPDPVETCTVTSSTDTRPYKGRNTEHALMGPREGHPGRADREELPQDGTRGLPGESVRMQRGAFGDGPSLDYFDGGGVLSLSNIEAGVSSAELDQLPEQQKYDHRRNKSRRAASLRGCSVSDGTRHDGRPVRLRKKPKRYSPEEDNSPDKRGLSGSGQQTRGRKRGIFNFNIVGTPAPSGETNPTDQRFQRGTSNDSNPQPGNSLETSLFNSSHTLESNILEDCGDARGSPSTSFSELMEGGSLQNASWPTSAGISALDNTPRAVEPSTSDPVGMLPGRIGQSLSATAAPQTSSSVPQTAETDSALQMASSLYATTSSSLATSSVSMQIRRELTSDMEANDQCDDEERAGTVNDHVEE